MTYKHTICALAAAVITAGIASPAMAEEPKHILMFGNSFTISNDLTGRLWLIARADGHVAPRIVGDLTGGTYLSYHVGQIQTNPENNIDSPAVIPGDSWDAVVIQGYSTETTHIGNPQVFRDNALSIMNSVRNAPNNKGYDTTAILFETWARGPTNSMYPTTFANPTEMQAEIRNSYQAATNDIKAVYGNSSAIYAPVGDSFEDFNFDLSLYGSDIYHPSAYGTTLSALVLYRTIYGENVSDISYSSMSAMTGITSTQWTTLTQYVDGLNLQVIPEPGMLSVVGIGALGLMGRRRRI